MHPAPYHRPASLADALILLAEPGRAPLGGGTDLLPLMKAELARPAGVVDLRYLPGARERSTIDGGGLRIGAGARIHELAVDADIRARWPLLSEACAAVGTPALRHMGTLGGNLCQRPRCWYFRRRVPCHKNGGDDCPAVAGENQQHAILGGGPCWIVHPSDPAVALVALDAELELDGPRGTRREPIAGFFALPSQRLDHETILEPGEIVTAVRIPGGTAGGIQRYEKLMERATWDFAVVSLAAARRATGEVRLVLGGVAPVPWRIDQSVEEDVASGALDDRDVETLAARALYDARPLSRNAYKVALAEALLRRAIAEVAP